MGFLKRASSCRLAHPPTDLTPNHEAQGFQTRGGDWPPPELLGPGVTLEFCSRSGTFRLLFTLGQAEGLSILEQVCRFRVGEEDCTGSSETGDKISLPELAEARALLEGPAQHLPRLASSD